MGHGAQGQRLDTRHSTLDTREARGKLKARGKPYYRITWDIES
jgi:hypothetical protein